MMDDLLREFHNLLLFETFHPHTLNQHTNTHHFLRTGTEVRQIRSHVELRVPTTKQKASHFRIHARKRGDFYSLWHSLFDKDEACREYCISVLSM